MNTIWLGIIDDLMPPWMQNRDDANSGNPCGLMNERAIDCRKERRVMRRVLLMCGSTETRIDVCVRVAVYRQNEGLHASFAAAEQEGASDRSCKWTGRG
jgi:hypothetical protein